MKETKPYFHCIRAWAAGGIYGLGRGKGPTTKAAAKFVGDLVAGQQITSQNTQEALKEIRRSV